MGFQLKGDDDPRKQLLEALLQAQNYAEKIDFDIFTGKYDIAYEDSQKAAGYIDQALKHLFELPVD